MRNSPNATPPPTGDSTSSRVGYFSSWKHGILSLCVLLFALVFVAFWSAFVAVEFFDFGAFRCKCMSRVVSRPGILNYLITAWICSAGFLFLGHFVDFHRNRFRPFKNRFYLSAAILVVITYAVAGFYATTVDAQHWRAFTDDGGMSNPHEFHRQMFQDAGDVTRDVTF